MKLSAGQLRQVIKEEVQNLREQFDDEDDGESRYPEAHEALERAEDALGELLHGMPKLKAKLDPVFSQLDGLHQDVEMYDSMP
jgi:predicted nuclease with TOPRIM domain